jgi:hypothetical protein
MPTAHRPFRRLQVYSMVQVHTIPNLESQQAAYCRGRHCSGQQSVATHSSSRREEKSLGGGYHIRRTGSNSIICGIGRVSYSALSASAVCHMNPPSRPPLSCKRFSARPASSSNTLSRMESCKWASSAFFRVSVSRGCRAAFRSNASSFRPIGLSKRLAAPGAGASGFLRRGGLAHGRRFANIAARRASGSCPSVTGAVQRQGVRKPRWKAFQTDSNQTPARKTARPNKIQVEFSS